MPFGRHGCEGQAIATIVLDEKTLRICEPCSEAAITLEWKHLITYYPKEK
jgi:hypothetical protein